MDDDIAVNVVWERDALATRVRALEIELRDMKSGLQEIAGRLHTIMQIMEALEGK